MQVEHYALYRMRLPFRQVFKHALAQRQSSESLLLQLTSMQGGEPLLGYGEALPRDYVSGETLEQTELAIRQFLPELAGVTLIDLAGVTRLCDVFEQRFEQQQCARALLELALLDLLSQVRSEPIAQWFGGLKTRCIQYSAVISDEAPEGLSRLVRQMQGFAVGPLKLKVGGDLARINAQLELLRTHYPSHDIRLDANGAWAQTPAAEIAQLVQRFAISSIEQPVITEDTATLVRAHAEIKSRCEVRLVLDEQVRLPAVLDELIGAQALDCLNIKISKVGGLINALRFHARAAAAGLECQLGANVGESSLITSAAQLFAGLTGDLIYHEGAYGSLLLEQDLCAAPVMFDQAQQADLARFDQMLGWGIEPDLAISGLTRL